MKRIIYILIVIFSSSFIMCGCSKSEKTQELSEDIDAYEKIAEIALKDFQNEEHRPIADAERYVVNLSEFNNYTELTSLVDIVDDNFSYLWIEDGNVVFWNDETKVLGLVYSSNPKEYIKVLGEWYKDIDAEKINENCYTVGQWMHQ